MSILLCIIALGSGQFLRLSPGVLSQGLGGASVVISEGLSIFHNPAYCRDMTFNVTLSRWLYATNHLTAGGVYQNNLFGITYVNYGRIQGYDELGNPTSVFTPYDICAGFGRKMGLVGLGIKVFNERIQDQMLYGVCGSAGIYVENEKLAFGLKVDNLGKEFAENTSIPAFIAGGLRYSLMMDLDLLVEAKFPAMELNSGFIYTYRDLRLFMGVRYLEPEDLVSGSDLSMSREDLYFTGGLLVLVEDYEVGYSIVYGPLAIAHQFSITFSPRIGN